MKKCNYNNCKIKIGLVNSFTCQKCNNNYCSKHRLFEDHNCDIFLDEIDKNKENGKLFYNELDKYQKAYDNSKIFDLQIKEIKN